MEGRRGSLTLSSKFLNSGRGHRAEAEHRVCEKEASEYSTTLLCPCQDEVCVGGGAKLCLAAKIAMITEFVTLSSGELYINHKITEEAEREIKSYVSNKLLA